MKRYKLILLFAVMFIAIFRQYAPYLVFVTVMAFSLLAQ